MANDPNRDVLPVKDSFDRGKFTLATIRGLLWICVLVTWSLITASCDRIEPHLVSRYRRPDLEDKFIKLYEENNELKRLNTVQDGKIKK